MCVNKQIQTNITVPKCDRILFITSFCFIMASNDSFGDSFSVSYVFILILFLRFSLTCGEFSVPGFGTNNAVNPEDVLILLTTFLMFREATVLTVHFFFSMSVTNDIIPRIFTRASSNFVLQCCKQQNCHIH